MKWSAQGLVLVVFLVTVVTIHKINESFSIDPIIIETSPLTHIPPHEHNHGDALMLDTHHHHLHSDVMTFDRDLWVTQVEFKLHNADATVLHHAGLINLGRQLWYCPNRTISIFSIGEDQMHHPILKLPKGYAQYIPKQSPLMLQTMVHNPLPPIGHGRDYYNVFASIKLHEAKPETEQKKVEMIQLNLLDDVCSDDFTVPANTTTFTKGDPAASNPSPATHRFSKAGQIVYMGGHLHGWEGGQYLDVYLNGNHLKRYTSQKATDDPYRYDTEHGPTDIEIAAGDILTITATYTNDNPVPITGAMGILAAYFAPH